MTRVRDLTGNRYGRLTVLRRAGSSVHGEAMWHCRCDCGAEHTVKGWLLTRGQTKSCGCLRRCAKERPAKPKRARRSKPARIEPRHELIQSGMPVSALDWARRPWA